VTRRYHRMQKHMFIVMCPGALFMEIAPGPPSIKNSASTFCTQMHGNALCEP
jgi:hypothetical protein